jgi:peptidoglycan hydrolase CwlO-like protein
MVSDELGKQLHDRATRGETLSAQERASLETWYAAQDRVEMDVLDLTTPETVTILQAQVDSVLEQLETAARRIQELAQENDRLRDEITTLHRRLAQQASIRAA